MGGSEISASHICPSCAKFCCENENGEAVVPTAERARKTTADGAGDEGKARGKAIVIAA
jgi:hypothetical protein